MKQKRRVLLVEDNPDDRQVVLRYLERDRLHRNEVAQVDSVEQALAALEERVPDVVILDQQLAASRGTDLLRELRRRGQTDLPVVFLTGSPERVDRATAEALQLGADDFLVKDELSESHLLRALATAAIKAQLRAELERSRREARLAAARISRMQRLTAQLGAATQADEIAAAVFESIPRLAAIDGAALLVAREGQLRVLATHGALGPAEGTAPELDLGDGSVLCDAVRDTEPVLVASCDALAPLLVSEAVGHTVSATILPLATPDGPVGALVLRWVGGDLEPDTTDLLLQAANLVSQALARALIQERLTQQLEFERRLIGVVSHDLRNPLSVCSMSVALLQRDTQISGPSARAAQKLQSAVRHMHVMVEQLLDLTRIRSHATFPISRAEVDVCQVVTEHIEELRTLHPDRTIALCCEGNGLGLYDPAGLGQVVSNLVGNALHYGAPERPIRVDVRCGPEAITVAVRNEGEPIAGDKLPTLFQPFARGDAGAHGENRSGLGLGLYITRGIVAAHGGDIDVVSDPTSTVFTVRLPRSGAR